MQASLIITRPEAQSHRFAQQIGVAWARPLHIVISPVLQIVPLPVQAGPVDALVLTSAHGAAAARRLGLPKGLPAWCVGDKTADLARAAGFVPHVGPGDAAGLVAQIIAARPKGRLVHLRGIHARGDVAAHLKAAGLDSAEVIAYDQQVQTLNNDAKSVLSARKPVIFPVFSPRTATILSQQGPFRAPCYVVALSQAVAESFDQGFATRLVVAKRPDMAAMLAATVDVLRGIGPE